MSKSRFFAVFLLIFLLAGSLEALYAQCSMCRAVLETGADEQAAEGLNDGIVYLMVFPYILVGIAFYMFYRFWRKRPSAKV